MLVSIGGQNGYWPADSACGQACVLNALSSFFDEYHCDGLDVDLTFASLPADALPPQPTAEPDWCVGGADACRS